MQIFEARNPLFSEFEVRVGRIKYASTLVHFDARDQYDISRLISIMSHWTRVLNTFKLLCKAGNA